MMEHIKNIILGPRYEVRLQDLGRWDRLEATCSRCRHQAIIDPAYLRQRWPGYTRVIELEGKLRCTACRNHDGNTLKTGRLVRD